MRTARVVSGGVGLLGAVQAQSVTYQAEDAVLTGVTVGTTVTGFTGSGYVEGFDTGTDKITFTVNSTTQALYDLSILYSAPYGSKQTYVVLNGVGGSSVSFTEGTAWTNVSAGQVLLNAGANTIEIQSNWGWYLIDAITVTPGVPRGPHQTTTTPVNPNANADAMALLAYFGSVYGKKIISGQQDTEWADWVTQNVGKSPAIVGYDFMDYTDSRTSRGASSTNVEQAIVFAQKGGIVTFSWHWGAPSKLLDTAEQPWWSGFYTAATTFDVAVALADTTNSDYQLLIHDIDTIAAQLKTLSDAGVPVLWRPLHEAEGGWFWWGAKGPEACKKLWALLYDRLTNYHKLNNLIWIWNSIAADWYPGDSTVDILSSDSYSQGDHGPISPAYNALLALGNDRKMIAATEVGGIPDPVQLQAYQADWVYFCTWSGDFISDGVWNPLDFLKRVYTSDYVLTLDEITGWKNAGSGTITTAGLP